MSHGFALRVALEPFRVRLQSFFPFQIGAHAGQDMQATLLSGIAAIAKEIAIAQILAMPVKRHFRGIESENASHADLYRIHFETGPIIGPLFNVERDRIVLGHINLADAAYSLVPRVSGARGRGQYVCCEGGARQRDKLTAIDFHCPS
jgi:hypothetical protein